MWYMLQYDELSYGQGDGEYWHMTVGWLHNNNLQDFRAGTKLLLRYCTHLLFLSKEGCVARDRLSHTYIHTPDGPLSRKVPSPIISSPL